VRAKGDRRYRDEHPDHFGSEWPFVSEKHAPPRWRAWTRNAVLGAVLGLGLFLVGAGIARIGQIAGWWG